MLQVHVKDMNASCFNTTSFIRREAQLKRRLTQYKTKQSYSCLLPIQSQKEDQYTQNSQENDFNQYSLNTVGLKNGLNDTEQSVQQNISELQQQQQQALDQLIQNQQKILGVPKRWQIVFMMALAFVLCNMDKMNMSVAIIPMAKEFGWSASQRGIVNSSFFWGYALTQIPAGFLATKFQGSRVILGGVLAWSLGTLIAPPLAHFNFWALCGSRVLVGLGEGFAPSAVTYIMANIIPSKERGRAVTSVFGSLELGSVVGLLLCSYLIKHFGWGSVFYFFGLAGIVWSAIWPLFHPSDPALNIQKVKQPQQSEMQNIPYKEFLKSRAVWAIIVAHFCFNWGYYALLTWLPSYFQLGLNLNVEKSSLMTLVPNLTMMLMTPFVGPVADGLLLKGWRTTHVRKLCQGLSFAVPSIIMIAVGCLSPKAVHDQGVLTIIIILLSISFAFGSWSRAGLYCNHQDLSPRYAGALLGLTNAAGALPGIIAVPLVGYLFDKTSSWLISLFLPTAFFQIVGLIFYTLFASSKKVDFDELHIKSQQALPM